MLRAKGYAEQFPLNHDLIKALAKRFQGEGIEVSWPVRKVHLYAHADGAAAPTSSVATPRGEGSPPAR